MSELDNSIEMVKANTDINNLSARVLSALLHKREILQERGADEAVINVNQNLVSHFAAQFSDEDLAEMFLFEGDTFRTMGKTDEALAAYDKVIALMP